MSASDADALPGGEDNNQGDDGGSIGWLDELVAGVVAPGGGGRRVRRRSARLASVAALVSDEASRAAPDPQNTDDAAAVVPWETRSQSQAKRQSGSKKRGRGRPKKKKKEKKAESGQNSKPSTRSAGRLRSRKKRTTSEADSGVGDDGVPRKYHKEGDGSRSNATIASAQSDGAVRATASPRPFRSSKARVKAAISAIAIANLNEPRLNQASETSGDRGVKPGGSKPKPRRRASLRLSAASAPASVEGRSRPRRRAKSTRGTAPVAER